MEGPHCGIVDILRREYSQPGNPCYAALMVCASVVLITFVVSTASRNYSQVDKIWSIIPFVYAWIPVCDDRTMLMAILATLWGLRLTWNFHRRGGYAWPPWSGDEDYRWAEIQKGNLLGILKNPVVWAFFNFFFISLYQNILLLLIVAPSFISYMVATHCEPQSLGRFDFIAICSLMFFIVIESIADNQQYAFQTEKYRRRKSGDKLEGDFADGFCQSGLFAMVRKPNYMAEQSIWICFYLFSIQATGQWWNWSAVGWILLCLLFQGSGWFTEQLTLTKYPHYSKYMKRVPLYVPNLSMLWKSRREKVN